MMTKTIFLLISCGLFLVGFNVLNGVEGSRRDSNGTATPFHRHHNNRRHHHNHHHNGYYGHHHHPHHHHGHHQQSENGTMPFFGGAPPPPRSQGRSSWRHQKSVEEWNKWVVLNFYQEFFGDKNIEAADKYIDPRKYIQHNPHVADGLQALKLAAVTWFEGVPKEIIDIRRVSADGDLVWTHTKTTMEDGKVGACVDIFRLENGKIVEHWDVQQAMPETSVNDHPLF